MKVLENGSASPSGKSFKDYFFHTKHFIKQVFLQSSLASASASARVCFATPPTMLSYDDQKDPEHAIFLKRRGLNHIKYDVPVCHSYRMMIIDHPTGQFTRSSSYSYTFNSEFCTVVHCPVALELRGPYPLPLAETTLIEHS